MRVYLKGFVPFEFTLHNIYKIVLMYMYSLPLWVTRMIDDDKLIPYDGSFVFKLADFNSEAQEHPVSNWCLNAEDLSLVMTIHTEKLNWALVFLRGLSDEITKPRFEPKENTTTLQNFKWPERKKHVLFIQVTGRKPVVINDTDDIIDLLRHCESETAMRLILKLNAHEFVLFTSVVWPSFVWVPE